MNSQIIDKGNYKIHLYKTDKFKSIEMRIVFRNQLSEDNYLYTALCQLLLLTSKYYKNKIDRYIKEEELYNEDFDFYTFRYGMMNCITAEVSFINPKLVHDDYIEEAIKHPFDILNNPLFDEEYLDDVKNKLKYTYHRRMEKPSYYADVKSKELFFDNQLYNASFYPEDSIVDSITMEQIKNTYDKLINNSNIDIFIVGDVDDKYIECIDKYNTFKSANCDLDLVIYNNYTDKVKEETEVKKDIKQAQIYMLYNLSIANKEDKVKLNIFNQILGRGGMNCRLFSIVREKNHLCYSVNSSYSFNNSYLSIYTGVDKDNIDKAITVIKEVVDSMKEITDDEINAAKVKYNSVLDYAFDSLSNIYDRMLTEYIGLNCDIEEERKIVQSITKEDIENMYNSIKLNTVFVLRGE